MNLTHLLVEGKDLFEDWSSELGSPAEAEVFKYLDRLGEGNVGKVKSVGGGVYEIKIPRPRKLRVYFGYESQEEIVLISGGDEKGQSRDIQQAKKLWQAYKNFQR